MPPVRKSHPIIKSISSSLTDLIMIKINDIYITRMAVFSRGILNGSIVQTPAGGQMQPSSGAGERLL